MYIYTVLLKDNSFKKFYTDEKFLPEYMKFVSKYKDNIEEIVKEELCNVTIDKHFKTKYEKDMLNIEIGFERCKMIPAFIELSFNKNKISKSDLFKNLFGNENIVNYNEFKSSYSVGVYSANKYKNTITGNIHIEDCKVDEKNPKYEKLTLYIEFIYDCMKIDFIDYTMFLEELIRNNGYNKLNGVDRIHIKTANELNKDNKKKIDSTLENATYLYL